MQRYWTNFPYGNVGCALGQVSGVVRIDVDGPEGESLLLQWSAYDLPPTWAFRSSPQGRGLLYAWPREVPCRSTAIAQPGDHHELRLMGNGSQTVLPPSRHPSGSVYTWDPGQSPADLPLAPAPPWLVDRLRVPPAQHHTRDQQTAHGTPEYARVMEALAALPNHDVGYDCWLKIGMALHSTGQSWAREAWDTWSQHSTKYDAAKQEKSWGSFDEDRTKKATLGTLFYLAQQAGWQPPRQSIPDMTQPPTPDPDDPEEQSGVKVHRLPEHLRNHPDPRVRCHWQRVYRKANTRKHQLNQDVYAFTYRTTPAGGRHDGHD